MRVESRLEPINQAFVLKISSPILGRFLTFRSDWTSARTAAYRWPISDLDPGSMHTVSIAGRQEQLTADENGHATFEWDGLDDQGEHVGQAMATLDDGERQIRLGRWDPLAIGLGGLLISGYDHLDVLARRVHTSTGRLKGNLLVRQVEDGYEIPRNGRRAIAQFDSDGYLRRVVDNHSREVERYERDSRGLTSLTRGKRSLAIERDLSSIAITDGEARFELDLDDRGRVATLEDPAGAVVSFDYSPTGLLISAKDPSGFEYVFTYDEVGRLESYSAPGTGQVDLVRTAVDGGVRVNVLTGEGRESFHQVQKQPDGEVVRTLKCCDDHPQVTRIKGGVIESTNPDGSRVINERRSGRRQVILPSGLTHVRTVSDGLIDVNGHTTERIALDNGTLVRTPSGREHRVHRTDTGFVVTRPDGTETEVVEDDEGRVIQMTDADQTMEYQYGADGLVASVSWPDGATSRFEHTESGWLTAQHFADGRSVLLERDGSGLLRQITTPIGDHIGFRYISRDLPSQIQFGSPDDRIEFEYDRDGLLVAKRETAMPPVVYQRDTNGRVAQIEIGDQTTSVSHRKGSATEVVAPDGQKTIFQLDGNLVTAVEQHGSADGSVEYRYGPSFKCTEIRSGSLQASLEYDVDGRLARASEARITRDPAGRISRIDAGTVSVEYRYTPAGLTESIIATANGEQVWTVAYEHDRLRRISRINDSSEPGPIEIEYDEAGNLIAAGSDFQADWDGHGNPLNVSRNGEASTGIVEPVDRLTALGPAQIAYEGSRVRAIGDVGISRDAQGRVTGVKGPSSSTELVRDGLGRLIGIARDEHAIGLISGRHDRPEVVLGADGSPEMLLVGVNDSDTPLVAVEPARILLIVQDHQGSVRRVIDIESGEVVDARDYDVWGRLMRRTGDSLVPYGFAGGIDDPQHDLVHFPERSYSTTAMRWLSRDPRLFSGGASNLYAYCNNDPVNYRDPKGATVEVCRRKTDLFIAPEVIFEGKEHWWLRTTDEEAGMGSGGGSKVGVLDHKGEGDREGSECDPVDDVDEECVNGHIALTRETPGGIKYGKSLGYYGPTNTCQFFVDEVLDACSNGEYSIQTDNPEAYEHWYNPDTNVDNYSSADQPIDYTPDPGQSSLDDGELWE